jgi:dephospho-CoA kinase
LANSRLDKVRIAITGGIGEGKSTVLSLLAETGHSVASADAISREFEVPNGNEIRWN